tara:strand:- start:1539 stop:2939 length:1401 start_codon:yes stop_codon:yes gene_type:complete
MQNKHILIVLKFGSFFGYIESVIKELTLNNKVTLCVQEDNKINSTNYYIDSKDGSLVIENLRLNKKIILAKKTDNLNIIYGVKRRDSWVKILINIRETLNYISYLIRGDRNTFFQNQSKYVSKKISSFLKIIKFKFLLIITFNLLKLIHKVIPSSKIIKKFIADLDPDLVLVVGANWPTRKEDLSSEVDFIKASNQLKKPSIAHVISWDNLIARGLYHYNPSVMFVWNKSHYQEAINVHKMPKDILRIIGAPFMDKWFENLNVPPKIDFFKSIGLDENKPLVTYLGSAKNISTSENEVVEILHDKLSKSDIQLIVRPHGANTNQFDSIKNKIKIVPLNGELPDTVESKKLMVATLKYSDLTVGINTTAMIDSVILNTPCISIIKNEYSFNQSDTPHFKKVQKEGIFIKARNENEILRKIIEFNNNDNSILFRKMNNFVKEFCRPFGLDTSAAKRALLEIDDLIARK